MVFFGFGVLLGCVASQLGFGGHGWATVGVVIKPSWQAYRVEQARAPGALAHQGRTETTLI